MTTGPADIHTAVFGALADPTRQRILELISTDGSCSASSLAHDLPITRQAIVKHLKVLEAAELISSESVGRSVYYRVRPDRSTEAARWLADIAAEWASRGERLRRLAASRDTMGS